jgi:hypothetical protein
MKIWLDDQIDDKACPARHPPDGFVGINNANAALIEIYKGIVTHIDFDHDLGDNTPTGYDVARAIEELAFAGLIPRLTWSIHSANPVGRKRIEMAMRSADRFWLDHESKKG